MNRAALSALGLGLLLGLSTACAGSMKNAEVVPPGALLPLSEDEGYLIVQIDTDVPVEQVLFDTGPVASALPKGQHLWILRLPARRYAWYRIDLGSQAGVNDEYLVSHDGLSHENEFEFDVLPGIINYPGELIIRTDAFFRSSGKVWVRNRNHSAMAIRRLGFPATGSFRGSVL